MAKIAIKIIAVAIAIGILAFSLDSALNHRSIPIPQSFNGSSAHLNETDVVPTLDIPLDPSKNTIWCASFVSAWKAIETNITEEPIKLNTDHSFVQSLNTATDPSGYVDPASLYANAGWVEKGIIQDINDDLASLFPEKPAPEFPGIAPNSFLAYAYLESQLKFGTPYFQNDKPLQFSDSSDNTTDVNSFGIRATDEYAYFDLRRQLDVLHVLRNKPDPETGRLDLVPREFIVDLDESSEDLQFVAASVQPGRTLAETLESVQAKIAAPPEQDYETGFGPNDVFLIPDLNWEISHHFTELEGTSILNTSISGQRIDVALQDIRFVLSRGGVELASEAKMYMRPIPTHYVFNRPFLIYLKRRDAETPLFVMWVANSELLSKHEPTE